MKKTLALLLLTALLITPLSGCNTTDENKPDDTVATTDNVPEYNAADANPASDFEYKVGEDGGITITKYIGTDSDVVIPEKIDGKDVTVIGKNSFNENQTLISIAIPDTVWLIDGYAFVACKKLTTVRMSKNLEAINISAFDGCVELADAVLPNSLTTIGERAFAGCKSLKHIRIPSSCYRGITENGTAYYPAANSAFAHSGIETLVLEDGIEYIPKSAFSNTNLKEVIIPGSVQFIRDDAFYGCESLVKITLSEGITTIARTAFSNTGIIEITIPSSVVDMTGAVFNLMPALQKVYFEGNVPEYFIYDVNQGKDSTFTIYYHEDAEGFTTPEWNGYKTEIR